ncbi:hypothetical protein [Antarctobacter jejuensis]|uniref:hypothetical protein n=1 Tax=Antarctobacter jejuensis TaxID=1439938 RepID=UPI003FCFF15B
MFPIRCLILLCLLVLPARLPAQSASLFAPAGDTSGRTPFVTTRSAPITPAHGGSLFGGGQRHSFFAPLPERTPDEPASPAPNILRGNSQAAKIRDLIAQAEAGRKGYDEVNGGARVKPPKPPTQMTVQEIYDWIDATPGQPHAIGRYQFIPATLRRLVSDQRVSRRAVFSPALQDQLADQLLAEAGLLAFKRGEITRRSFMYRLAKIWAGLPLPSGKSYYEGYAGNKATMTWARFDGAMAQIFPG